MKINTSTLRRGGAAVAAAGVTAGLLIAPATAGAAPLVLYSSGSGRAQITGDDIRFSFTFWKTSHVSGSLSYFDGNRWLYSTRTGSFTVNGRVAKAKGEGRWNGRNVVFYLQVRDRSPKRRDTISIKVKQGKRVVLRQSEPLSSGDLVVRSW